MTTTADWRPDAGTTPPEIAPPGMAMAKSPPALDTQNALMNMDDIECTVSESVNALIDQPPRNYASLHNASLHSTPAVTTGSRTLDRTLNLAPCRVCGRGEDLLTIWYDDKPDTVCGDCFAWACQAYQTIKVQKFYV